VNVNLSLQPVTVDAMHHFTDACIMAFQNLVFKSGTVYGFTLAIVLPIGYGKPVAFEKLVCILETKFSFSLPNFTFLV
jgi:hypothetical protein